MTGAAQGQPQTPNQAVPGTAQPTYQQAQQPGQGWGYQQQPQTANISVQAGDAGQAGRRPTGAEAMYTDLNFNDLSAAEPAIPPSTTGRSKYGTM